MSATQLFYIWCKKYCWLQDYQDLVWAKIDTPIQIETKRNKSSRKLDQIKLKLINYWICKWKSVQIKPIIKTNGSKPIIKLYQKLDQKTNKIELKY